MLDAAHFLATAAVVLLILAFAAWVTLPSRPQSRWLHGSAAASVGNREVAALLLCAAVVLSALAAILAMGCLAS
jgi:hypothetical protein